MGKMTLGMHIFYGSRTFKMHCTFSRSESEPVNYKLGGSRAAMAISPADFPPNPRSLNSSYRDRGSNGTTAFCTATAEPSSLTRWPRKWEGVFPTFSGHDQLLPSLMLLWKRGHLARGPAQRQPGHFGISHLCKCLAFTRHQARVKSLRAQPDRL